MVSRREIARTIADRVGCSTRTAEAVVSEAFRELARQIIDEEHVELRGFGIFDLVWRKAKRGRIATTGEEIQIPATWSVKFRPAQAFKDALDDLEPAE